MSSDGGGRIPWGCIGTVAAAAIGAAATILIAFIHPSAPGATIPSLTVTASPEVTAPPTVGLATGPLIAQLPKPPRRPYASIAIQLSPLFQKTPSAGFDVGGLPNGTAAWYVAWETGILVQADGKDWVDTLSKRGYATSPRPTVGAIVSWRAFSPGYGAYGHVALVVDVDPDGQGFTVAEANVLGLGKADVRWVPLANSGIVGFVP